ncbi:MAG: DsrE family protein [Campylobacterales bacterium]|nr:DsrE family protein [Campylobacterales bacterium]
MNCTKLTSILLLVAIMITPSLAQKDADDTVTIVYQCDFADPKRVHLLLNTLNNVVKHYQTNFVDFEVNLVALGPCLQYVMKDFKDTRFMKKPYIDKGGPTGAGTASRLKILQQQAGDSLEIYACGNTMQNNNVKPEQIADNVKITPSGIIKIVERQKEGYAYIKIK